MVLGKGKKIKQTLDWNEFIKTQAATTNNCKEDHSQSTGFT